MPSSVNIHFYFFESLDFHFKSPCSLLIWHGSSNSFYENKRTKQLVNTNWVGVFKQEKLHEAKEQWISTPDGVLLTPPHPPPPKKKKAETKTNTKKTKKQNKARPWSTCLQEAIFLHATCLVILLPLGKCGEIMKKKKQINLFKPKRNATDPIIYWNAVCSELYPILGLTRNPPNSMTLPRRWYRHFRTVLVAMT